MVILFLSLMIYLPSNAITVVINLQEIDGIVNN